MVDILDYLNSVKSITHVVRVHGESVSKKQYYVNHK